MASIIYKSLSSLSPVELKYEYHRNENLRGKTITHRDGFSFFELDGLNSYQDVTINKDSAFILTSATDISNFFTSINTVTLGKLPGSFKLQPRNSTTYFVTYNDSTNIFAQALSPSSVFSIGQPREKYNTGEVELYVNNKYVQVESEYPYKVYLNERALDPEDIHRQRFEVVYNDGLITFKTKTNTGYRYLAFNNDNVLRAVGLVLNNTTINDYVFKCISITQPILKQGFIPSNDWVTYYFSYENPLLNKTVSINKVFTTTPTNFLVDFPIKNSAEQGIANINIANLKTSVTPSGTPASITNY